MAIWQQNQYNSSQQDVDNLLDKVGFATLISHGDYQYISHIPYEYENNNDYKLRFHLSVRNPQAEDLINAKQATAVIMGNNGYISPRWYFEDQQVPTWAFETVHLFGDIAELNEEQLISHLDRLTLQNEDKIGSDYCIAELDSNNLHNMARAIRGFELTVTEVSSKFKMAQNKKGGTKKIVEGLNAMGNRALAESMKYYNQS